MPEPPARPDSPSPGPHSAADRAHSGTAGDHRSGRASSIAASLDIAAEQLRSVRHRRGAHVLVDVHCGRCGYNLKGLEAAGVCPECGNPNEASLLATPELRSAAELIAGAAQFYGTGHRATGGFALILLTGACGTGSCLTAIGTVVVGLGCAQRLIGLAWMRRVDKHAHPGSSHAFRAALFASALETSIGLLIFLSLFFDLTARLPGAIGSYATIILFAGWAGAVGLGMVASALLADSLGVRFSLNVERSMLPVRLALAAPLAYLAFLIARELAYRFPSNTPLLVCVLATVAVGIAAWLLAAWAACAYFVGTTDLMHGAPAQRAAEAGGLRMADLPTREARTEAERAAKRAREDDSPIPMD